MDKLIFTSLSQATSGNVQRVQLTNDLANVSTVGFKRALLQRSIPSKLDGPGFGTRFQPLVATQNDVVNLTEGNRMQTDNPMDIALNGQTVLGVFADDGNLAFTRRGDLRVSQDGFIETSTGLLVSDEGGAPITVPQGGTVTFTPDGAVFFNNTIAEAGVIAPQQIGLLLMRDASATQLQRRTDGLFEVTGANGQGGDFPTGPEIASLTSGALEGSNVQPVEVLVELMDYYRSFETQIKVIKSVEELDKDANKLMRVT
jgi:flagellar basal-body rod protein FlgF